MNPIRSMNRIHVNGGKNHGKTTLVGEILVELRARGLCVGAIKHTHHHHELDTPGKDSHRHRASGAAVVGILSPGMNAVFWSNGRPDERDYDRRYDRFVPIFADCDVVLVEGDTRTTAPKLEVWRAELGTPPLADRLTGVRCVVTDDPLDRVHPLLPRSDVSAIAEFVLQILKMNRHMGISAASEEPLLRSVPKRPFERFACHWT